MTIVILPILSLILIVILALSYYREKFTLYYVFFFFGLGIGPLLYNLNIKTYFIGLRIESWSWLIIMLFLIIGLTSNKKINSSIRIISKTNFKYYLFYILLLFIGLFRSESLSEGLGLSLTMLFSMLVVFHFYSNQYSFNDLQKLIYFSLIINTIVLMLFVIMGNSIIQYDYTGTPRLTGSMGWASFAYFLMIPFNLFLIKTLEEPKKVYFIVLCFLALLIVATVSRTGLLMLLLSIVSIITILHRGKLVIVGSSIVVFAITFMAFYELFYTRFFYSTTSVIATSGRLTAVLYLFDSYVTDLLFFFFGQGTGVARVSLENLADLGIRRIHSALGEAFFDIGILGAFLLLIFVVKSFFSSWRSLNNLKINFNYKNRPEKKCIRYLLLGMLGSVMLFPLILLENMYNPFLTSVLFLFVLFGELQVDRLKTIKMIQQTKQ